ncbi:MAG: hypothetical protein ACRCR9_05090 [Chitinophagaceae bacterium]
MFVKRSEIDAISKGNIIVEDHVWIGYGVKILSGVTIGKGSIVSTGSIVTKDIPPYTIVGGIPARVIKKRFTDETISKLLTFDLSMLSTSDFLENINLFYSPIEENKYPFDEIHRLIKNKSRD